MSDVWLDIEQVHELTGWRPQWARKLAARGQLHTRPSDSRGANGKHEREYLLSSLPAAAQMKWAKSRHTSGGQAQDLAIVRVEGSMALFESAPLTAVAESARLALPENLRVQAETRYAAIAPLLDFRRRTNGHRPTFKLSNGRMITSLDGLAKYIGPQQRPPVSGATVWRWYTDFIDPQGGYAALADAPRKDKGQSRTFEQHPAAAAFLQQKFLGEGLSRQMSWEALAREWDKIENKGSVPSYGTARNYLNALPEPVKVLGREGSQAHWSKCSPSVIRGPMPAMDWWVADHRVFDVLIRSSLFGELPAQKAFRLWMTMVCDWGSRKIVGFCFAPTPSSRTISSALRLAILSHGMPRNFYWDNGEDYKKVRRDLEAITLSQEAGALLARDGVGVVSVTSALPFRPRSKPIESWFARWSKRFDVIWGKAYLGNKPGACPESARVAQKQHEDFLKGKRADSPLPLDAEFIAATVTWIDEYNATRLEALDHRTPNDVMEEQCPEASRPQINPRLLDILFWERDLRTVQAGGCVELDRRRYEPTDQSLLAMDTLKGRQVMVLRDPYNLGEAVAADAETLQFIGELRIQQFVAQCPGGQITRDQIQAAMRRERSLRRGYSEYLAALAAIASSQGWRTEREGLLERAGVRTGTDRAAVAIAGVPGARKVAALPSAPREIVSPFVDDAAASFIAAMAEEEAQ